MHVRIIPEALELMDFYNSSLEHDDVVKIVKEQNRKHGRFGLARIGADISEKRAIGKYWKAVRGYEDEIRKERDFVNKVLEAKDLQETVERGLEKAKTVFLDKEFNDITVILTAGLDNGDARVMCTRSFGVNLSSIFGKESDVEKAKRHIESYSVHEGNHVFLYQRGFSRGILDKERLKGNVFMEGLATFLEIPEVLETRDTHKAYIKDVNVWEGLLQEYLKAENSSSELLKKMVNQDSFRKLNSGNYLVRRVSKIKDFVDDELYEDIVDRVFVSNNGPAYHIGYNMWKMIEGAYGTEKVRDVVAGGPFEFFDVYEKLKQ